MSYQIYNQIGHRFMRRGLDLITGVTAASQFNINLGTEGMRQTSLAYDCFARACGFFLKGHDSLSADTSAAYALNFEDGRLKVPSKYRGYAEAFMGEVEKRAEQLETDFETAADMLFTEDLAAIESASRKKFIKH